MFGILYNFFLGAYFLFTLPRYLLNFKKYRSTLVERLFFVKKNISIPKEKKVIWIHAVSLGETKVASLLAKKIKDDNKDIYLIISSTTKTGFEEAQKNISFADHFLFLPLDFSWTMKRLMNFFNPSTLILTESDFWYNFLCQAKKKGAKTILVNGKISEKSFKRFKNFSFFSKKLFSLIDEFCLQSLEYKSKFLRLKIGENRIHVTGNLKLELKQKEVSKEEIEKWKKTFKISENQKVISIASTHDPEEEQLLRKLDYKYKYLLIPRHPERFQKVKEILRRNNISFGLYSQVSELTGSESVILIDTMGFLNICYSISDLAIVGGSFTPKIGGHNILESIFAKTFVLFGPFMYSQEEIKKIALNYNCAQEVSLENIKETISNFFKKDLSDFDQNCEKLKEVISGSVNQTYLVLKKYC